MLQGTLYRIAETVFCVARGGISSPLATHQVENRVGGAIDGAWGTQARAHLGQPGAQGAAGICVLEQANRFACDLFGREVGLDQLGYNALVRDQIDHAEEFRAYQRLR